MNSYCDFINLIKEYTCEIIIFFKNNQDTILKFLASLIGSVISAYVAIHVVFLRLKKEKEKELQDKKERINNLRVFLIEILNFYIDKIKDQKDKLDKNIDLINEKNFKSKVFSSSVGLNIKSLKSIEHIDMFKIFNLHKSDEHKQLYKDFLTQTESLKSSVKFLPILVNEFNLIFKKIQSDINLFSNQLFRLHDNCYFELDLNKSNNNDLNNIIRFWHVQINFWVENIKKGKLINDPYILFDEVYLPLKISIDKKKYDAKLIEILTIINQFEAELDNHKNQQTTFSGYFTDLKTSFDKVEDNYKNVIEKLSKLNY